MYSKNASAVVAGRLGVALGLVVAGVGLVPPPAASGQEPSPKRVNGPLELPADAREAIGKRRPEGVADLRAIQEQVRRVVEHVRPTVVAVQIKGSMGSGVIVSADGLVLTAGHVVVKPGLRVTFFFPDGSRAEGVTLGMNSAADSGMLRITDPGPWPFTPVAGAGATKRGDWVVTLGQPNGFFEGRLPPVRLGRVLSADDEVIQTDCTLVGGDSGGPLVNLRGEVIGIHSRIARSISSNFHVPISVYHEGWGALLAGQVYGGRDNGEPPDYRANIGFAGGMVDGRYRITQVFPSMPAAEAGVKRGDIVRAYNGEPIAAVGELPRMVLSSKPNKVVTLDIERDGLMMQIEVRLSRLASGFPGAPPLPKS